MRSLFATIVICLFLPNVSVGAVTVSNSGSVNSETSSSADTVGNSVGSGGSVTAGNASASASTEVSSDGSGGSVKVKVETESDGEKKVEEYRKDLNAGESIDVKVQATSKSGGGKSESTVKVTTNGSDIASSSASTTPNAEAVTMESASESLAKVTLVNLFTGIKNVFHGFFRLFFSR